MSDEPDGYWDMGDHAQPRDADWRRRRKAFFRGVLFGLFIALTLVGLILA